MKARNNAEAGRAVKPLQQGLGDHRIPVAILEDHPATLHGLSALIEAQPDMRLVASAQSERAFIDRLDACACCQVAVVDFVMPEPEHDAEALLATLRQSYTGLKVLVISAHCGAMIERLIWRCGGSGFLAKHTAPTLLLQAIRALAAADIGKSFICCRKGSLVIQQPDSGPVRLSCREQQVMALLATGLTVAEAALRLQRSPKTVSAQKRSAMRKLGLAGEMPLALYLQRYGSRLDGSDGSDG